MTYHNAIKYIRSAPNIDPADNSVSDRISKLCEALGNPHKKIKYVRLAGSNGKTVCARMLISILNSAGIVNGCLSMPVYAEIRDNIRIGGEPISIEEITKYVEQLSAAVSAMNANLEENTVPFRPTLNEIMICLALLAFVDHNCELCIIESDHNSEDPSRFIYPPLAAVICGRIPDSDTKEITKIRSYICRGVREIISAPQNPDAFKVISDTCASVNCRLTLPNRTKFDITRLSLRGSEFSYKDNDYSLRICGKFQTMNALIAIETAEMLVRCGYNINRESIQSGLASVIAPCKFEILSISPTIIADSTYSSIAIGAVCDSLADFKEMTGTRIRLCLPKGDLIPQYVDALEERGYSIEKVSSLNLDSESTDDYDYSFPINVMTSVKHTVKDALEDLDNECMLLISGHTNFTRTLKYELLATLGF